MVPTLRGLSVAPEAPGLRSPLNIPILSQFHYNRQTWLAGAEPAPAQKHGNPANSGIISIRSPRAADITGVQGCTPVEDVAMLRRPLETNESHCQRGNVTWQCDSLLLNSKMSGQGVSRCAC